jgi:adenylate kinase family enzyme
MVNYNNGKIYKIEPIVDHEEDEIYIGSTTKQYLSQRMDSHRNDYRFVQSGKRTSKCSACILFDKYKIENCQIVLLETVQANSKDELLARERFYIQQMKCINKIVPGRTDKEYRKDNEENIKAKHKEYREKNKKKIYEKCQQTTLCECGSHVHTYQISRHNKSKKHIDFINQKKNNLI